MVDAVLEQTCRVQRRVRDLPARVVVYLLLAGCLFAELGYAQVWDRLTAGLGGLPAARPTAAAMTQARRRLGPGPLRELFFLLRGPAPASARWRGLLVAAVDGTIMTVADSAANLAVYSKHRGGPNGGSSYPSLRLLALVSCGTRSVIDAVFGPVSDGETTYAARLLGSLRAGMLLLADRNFGSGPLDLYARGPVGTAWRRTGVARLARPRPGHGRWRPASGTGRHAGDRRELAPAVRISRQEQDEFALRSHQRAVAAQRAGIFKRRDHPSHGARSPWRHDGRDRRASTGGHVAGLTRPVAARHGRAGLHGHRHRG